MIKNPKQNWEEKLRDDFKNFVCSRYQDSGAVVMQQERLIQDQDMEYTVGHSDGSVTHHKMTPAEQFEAKQNYKRFSKWK